MTDHQKPFILRDPRYPDGWVVAIASDYSVRGQRETSKILGRTRDDHFFVHHSTKDGVVTEDVVEVDECEARRLYEQMPVQFASFPARPVIPEWVEELTVSE